MAANRRPRMQVWTLGGPFRRAGQFGWLADLPSALHDETDQNEQPFRCRLKLYEQGKLLGPAHALHRRIEDSGAGAYSFWDNVLYFSTSDGTDPNTNGRRYWATETPPVRESGLRTRWKAPARLLRCAVVGFGNRGSALGALAQSLPGVDVSWVIDHSADRRADAVDLFGIGVRVSGDVRAPLSDPDLDAVIVAVPDHLHRSVAEAAFSAGKHVFLEKPMATTIDDANAIIRAWRRSERILQLGYVLRQAPFYAAIRDVIRNGSLGPLRLAMLTEQLDVRHGASFMRRWHSNSGLSGGLMVHKGCHDLDLVCWLTGARPRRVSSFGGQATFAQPAPAQFCSVCDRRADCPYADNALHERRTAAERRDPTAFGLDRCVFHNEKDIVDNQVVAFELEGELRGTFTLAVQGPARSERTITLIGDRGTLKGVFEDGHFVITFTDQGQPAHVWHNDGQDLKGHGGGDIVTLIGFLDACLGRTAPPISSVDDALQGLVFAFAAERARKSGTVVHLADPLWDLNGQGQESPSSGASR